MPPPTPTQTTVAKVDPRSDDAMIWRAWYGTMRWKRRRRDQLRAHPFCAMCLRAKVYTAATVADHVVRHRGNPTAFWTGKLQSLCKHHHDKDKQREEMMATPLRVDADGWPAHRG